MTNDSQKGLGRKMHKSMKITKKDIGTEKDYLIAITELFDEWISTGMVKATETYKHWQHDKNSFAYGWIMGIKAAKSKLLDRKELL